MADTSAFDQPEARGLRLIVATLRVAVAAQCFGVAAVRLMYAGQSHLALLIMATRDVTAERCVQIDQATAAVLFACGMFSLTRPCWPILGPLTLFFFSDAVARLGQDSRWQLYAEIAEQSVCFVLPVALLMIDWYPPRAKFSLWRFMTAGSMTRAATAITFAAAGFLMLDAALHGGQFVTFLRTASEALRLESVPDSALSVAIALGGAVSIAAAANFMLTRSRLIAVGLAAWGLFWTAIGIPHYGLVEGVMRLAAQAAYVGAPSAIFLYWTLAVREREHVILPSRRPQRGRAAGRAPRGHAPGEHHAAH